MFNQIVWKFANKKKVGLLIIFFVSFELRCFHLAVFCVSLQSEPFLLLSLLLLLIEWSCDEAWKIDCIKFGSPFSLQNATRKKNENGSKNQKW